MEGPHAHEWYYTNPQIDPPTGKWFARRYCKTCFVIETFDLKETPNT